MGSKFRGSNTCVGKDTGLMIIKLRKYNSAEELLIGLGCIGSQLPILNRNTEQRVSVSKVAVCMREIGTGSCAGYRGAYNRCLCLL